MSMSPLGKKKRHAFIKSAGLCRARPRSGWQRLKEDGRLSTVLLIAYILVLCIQTMKKIMDMVCSDEVVFEDVVVLFGH